MGHILAVRVDIRLFFYLYFFWCLVDVGYGICDIVVVCIGGFLGCGNSLGVRLDKLDEVKSYVGHGVRYNGYFEMSYVAVQVYFMTDAGLIINLTAFRLILFHFWDHGILVSLSLSANMDY